jgi:hypothetical protein
MANKIAAHNAGWRLQFRFAGGVLWSGMCELWRSIMKELHLILTMLICIGLGGCSKPSKNDGRSPSDVDRLVDEVWSEGKGCKQVPLKQWVSQSDLYNVDFMTREEAVKIAERSFKEYGIELLAVVENGELHWSRFVVGKVTDLKDKAAYTKALLAASVSRTLKVEYGGKWVVLTDQWDDDHPVYKGTPSPDDRFLLAVGVDGASGHAYVDRTKKTVSVSIGRGSGLDWDPVFQRDYVLTGSDMAWETRWSSPEAVSVEFYDWGDGVSNYNNMNHMTSSNHIALLSFVLDKTTGKFIEKK